MIRFQFLAVIVFGFVFSGALFFAVPKAEAQTLVSPDLMSGYDTLELAPSFTYSKIDYHFDGGGSTNVKRQIIGVDAAYGLMPTLDLYGEFGYSYDSDLKDGGNNNGEVVGAGLRALVFKQDKISVLTLAGVRYIHDRYSAGVNGDFFEIPLTAILKGKVTREIGLYTGIDVLPYTQARFNFEHGHRDAKREDPVGLRLGADYKMDDLITFSGEFSLISEESFIARISFPL